MKEFFLGLTIATACVICFIAMAETSPGLLLPLLVIFCSCAAIAHILPWTAIQAPTPSQDGDTLPGLEDTKPKSPRLDIKV